MTYPLVQISSKHCQSQTGRDRELKFWENFHPTLGVRCQVSGVTCHLSSVTCHLSPVTCQMSIFSHFFPIFLKLLRKLDNLVELVGGGFRYQRGLPHLVFIKKDTKLDTLAIIDNYNFYDTQTDMKNLWPTRPKKPSPWKERKYLFYYIFNNKKNTCVNGISSSI